MATLTTTTTTKTLFIFLFFILTAAMTNAAEPDTVDDQAPEKLGLGCISACQATCSELSSTWAELVCYAGCDLLCAAECEESLGVLCKGKQRTRKLMGPSKINAFEFKARLVSNNNGGGGNGKDDADGLKTEP